MVGINAGLPSLASAILVLPQVVTVRRRMRPDQPRVSDSERGREYAFLAAIEAFPLVNSPVGFSKTWCGARQVFSRRWLAVDGACRARDEQPKSHRRGRKARKPVRFLAVML